MSGLIGFLVVVGLAGATVLLFRSMTRHLRKVPKSFDQPPSAPSEPPHGPDSPPDN
jgi:hypothetical protein